MHPIGRIFFSTFKFFHFFFKSHFFGTEFFDFFFENAPPHRREACYIYTECTRDISDARGNFFYKKIMKIYWFDKKYSKIPCNNVFKQRFMQWDIDCKRYVCITAGIYTLLRNNFCMTCFRMLHKYLHGIQQVQNTCQWSYLNKFSSIFQAHIMR